MDVEDDQGNRKWCGDWSGSWLIVELELRWGKRHAGYWEIDTAVCVPNWIESKIKTFCGIPQNVTLYLMITVGNTFVFQYLGKPWDMSYLSYTIYTIDLLIYISLHVCCDFQVRMVMWMWRKTLVLKKIWRVARLGAGFFSTRDFEGTVITGATISNKQKYVEKKTHCGGISRVNLELWASDFYDLWIFMDISIFPRFWFV